MDDGVIWSDGNDPVTRRELYEPIRAAAAGNGCQPLWHDGIFGWAWHCTCPAETHWVGQQCSAISLKTAKRKPR